MNRPSWEQYALMLAKTASSRSEDPYKKVGACALDHNNRVLGVAYNGLVSKKKASNRFWRNREVRRQYMIHAEQNLLSLFKRGEAKLIACTLLPCSDCARLICSWEIPVVCYLDDYERDLGALSIFKFYGTSLKKISLP
jgi:dCMP deaminase